MRNVINSPFLSCISKGQQSFLSCDLKTQNVLPNTRKFNLAETSASKLPCNSANALESDDKSVLNYRAKSLIVGIDPGISGAIAFVKSGALPCYVAVYDLPVHIEKSGKTRLDLESLSVLISTYSQDINLALVEEVGQIGTKADPFSSFVFGFATGAVHGVLASHSVSIQTVKPITWKAALGLDSDKSKSIAKAIKFFPQAASKLTRKKDHGRAEALLLAYFANSLTWRNAK